jgi:hypothetical protein
VHSVLQLLCKHTLATCYRALRICLQAFRSHYEAAIHLCAVLRCVWAHRSLSNVARSVLLTSGTLSPLDSFSGELGLDFHVKLEAPHVVDINRQVCVGGGHVRQDSSDTCVRPLH